MDIASKHKFLPVDLANGGAPKRTLKPLEIEPVDGIFPCPVEIRTDDSEGCPAFYGRVIRGVKNGPFEPPGRSHEPASNRRTRGMVVIPLQGVVRKRNLYGGNPRW